MKERNEDCPCKNSKKKSSACPRESLEYSVSQKLQDKSVSRCWEVLIMWYAMSRVLESLLQKCIIWNR